MMAPILDEMIFFAICIVVFVSCSKKTSKGSETKSPGPVTAVKITATPASARTSVETPIVEEKKAAVSFTSTTSTVSCTTQHEDEGKLKEQRKGQKKELRESSSATPPGKKKQRVEETPKKPSEKAGKPEVKESANLKSKTSAEKGKDKQEPSQTVVDCDREVSPKPDEFEHRLHFTKKEMKKRKDDSTDSTQMS
ncbi:unnamed protein product [Caenorhabditis sp. 36 PRJEB53466]|nr:unnamed protein product [Caenorhabditis sp. 36 PRJEB53466]